MGFFDKDKNTFGDSKNFKYLDDLIHSGAKEIVLDSDIVLSNGEESEYKDGITLDVDDLVIEGNGHSIDANGKTRIFYCTHKNIIIKNITLKNGFTKESGGAINNDEGELTITESTFTENMAEDGGGAIYNKKGELTITESTLIGNNVQGRYSNDGGAILNSGELTITESTFTENTAEGRGGAISNSEGELTITESTFTGNAAEGWGGAIHNGWRSELTIMESSLNNNTAKEGGGIYNSGSISITDSTLIGNGAQKNIVYEGGAINNHGSLIITSSTIAGNIADVNGGAIYNGGRLTITESELTGNTAYTDGGAIHNDRRSELTIIRSTLEENTAKRDGGAIYNENSELTITGSELTGNIADVNGGAIYNDNSELTITESTLNNNTANRDGGAIYNKESKLSINDSTLTENTANDGGAVYSGGNFKIYNSEFSCNKSPYRSIILNSDSLQIYNATFRNNQSEYIVLNDGDRSNLGIFNGEFKENDVGRSILYNNGKSCSIEKTVFQNNISINTIINKSELTLTNPKIKDKGKRILNQNYILIKRSPQELENKIYGKGTVETVENRISQSENFDFGYLDKKIHENQANEILLEHDITFENYEKDFYEGGIELDIDNLIIDGNGKTINGSDKSRIFIITGKNITLKNIIFKNGRSHNNYDNLLNNHGGAIKINYNNNITIENCEFINNMSEGDGGSIYSNYGCELTIVESAFTGNRADVNGGAIYDRKGELTITESSLNNNAAESCGVICGGNSIITDCKIDDLKGVAGNFEFRLTSENVDEFNSKIGESFPQVKTVNDFETFKKLIANNYKNIRLDSDLSIGEMEIGANDITIDGNGHTIYGSGTEGIFIVTGRNITFKNITFSGGRCTSDGRDAAYNRSRTSRYQDSHFYYYGGAIYVPGSGDCTCINCNFKNNVVGNDKMAKIERERINVCYGAEGGAIYAIGACKLINCHFKNNEAISGGSDDCKGCTEVIILDE